MAMQRILSKELKDHPDQKVRLKGWVNTMRSMGKISFLIVRDRAGCFQVVIEDKAEAKALAALQPGTIVTVVGTAKKAEKSLQGAEIIDPKITVEVAIKEPPPIEYTKPEIPSDLETILDHRSIALRNRKIQAVFTIQAELAHAYRQYMRDIDKQADSYEEDKRGWIEDALSD
ncbi:MAG: Aspartate--tRNA(Asp/Asn) ligase, partial [Chlamydiae bacterium]|nr:Aspartate--tRNA(Asp/Asn) ligase [Chlamydiota bacterium]